MTTCGTWLIFKEVTLLHELVFLQSCSSCGSHAYFNFVYMSCHGRGAYIDLNRSPETDDP